MSWFFKTKLEKRIDELLKDYNKAMSKDDFEEVYEIHDKLYTYSKTKKGKEIIPKPFHEKITIDRQVKDLVKAFDKAEDKGNLEKMNEIHDKLYNLTKTERGKGIIPESFHEKQNYEKQESRRSETRRSETRRSSKKTNSEIMAKAFGQNEKGTRGMQKQKDAEAERNELANKADSTFKLKQWVKKSSGGRTRRGRHRRSSRRRR